MSTLHVNFKAGAKAPSALYEAVTTSAAHAETTEVSSGNGSVVELYVVGGDGLLVSIGEAPNAETDTTRFYLPPDYPVMVDGVAKDMKVSAVDA